ncbi:hypothetical protein GOP47_0027063 [Adiantum capillus-veneris]|nr:hypothetical protein GOP47_0027063 [Adiantum capillus-veneris]
MQLRHPPIQCPPPVPSYPLDAGFIWMLRFPAAMDAISWVPCPSPSNGAVESTLALKEPPTLLGELQVWPDTEGPSTTLNTGCFGDCKKTREGASTVSVDSAYHRHSVLNSYISIFMLGQSRRIVDILNNQYLDSKQ